MFRRIARISSVLAVALTLVLSSIVTASAATPRSFSGTWQSNWGNLHLVQSGSKVSGTYDHRGGRFEFVSSTRSSVSGYWYQTSSAVRCDTARGGTHYWGRVAFDARPDFGRLDGNWAYCGKAPRSHWDAWR